MTDTERHNTLNSFRERTRDLIVARAFEVLSTEGLAAVQARRIAREAGCSIGSLYNIFGDIDGVILAANQITLHDLNRALTAAGAEVAGRPLAERLMALALCYLTFASEHAQRWRAVFEHRLPHGGTVPADYAADRQRLLALIAGELAHSRMELEMLPVAAEALFSAVHGIVQLSLDEKLVTFDAAHCERQIRFIIEPVARALS